jgi:hypothetical protein
MDPEYREPWKRVALAANELLAHGVLTVFVLLLIWVLDTVIHYLWGHNIIWFKELPFEFRLEWLFNAADIALLALFSIVGIAKAVTVYRGG